MQGDTNEVDVEDSSEIPNQSENQASGVSSDVGTSQAIGQSSSSTASSNTAGHSTYFSNEFFAPGANNDTADGSVNTDAMTEQQQPQENQQIQTISSGSDAGSSSQISAAEGSNLWRQSAATPVRQHQSAAQLTQTPQSQQQQQQQQLGLGFVEESGDDGIVPSTPTLYVPRRTTDGFSEAVSSPHLQVAARFTYESGGSRATNITSEGIDDTRVDLTQLDESGGVPIVPPSVVLTEPDAAGPIGSALETEPIPGTSTSEASVPDVAIDAEGQASEDIEDIDEEEGTDGVSSEGEKPGGNENLQVQIIDECSVRSLQNLTKTFIFRLKKKGVKQKLRKHRPSIHVHVEAHEAFHQCISVAVVEDVRNPLFGRTVSYSQLVIRFRISIDHAGFS